MTRDELNGRSGRVVADLDGKAVARQQVSIAVTTHGSQSFYTNRCLERIAEWKGTQHELVVSVHDASPLLAYTLRAWREAGVIDEIVWLPSGTGHIRAVHECFARANCDLLFNICNDILVGRGVVDGCALELVNRTSLGLIGWHWYGEGTYWSGADIAGYLLCNEEQPNLSEDCSRAIEDAACYTGATFRALGGKKAIRLANTSFFGVRRDVWDRVSGFDGPFEHYWADDFLCYKILDQGLDVVHFPERFRTSALFSEFQYQNTDVEDRRRNYDSVPLPLDLEAYLAGLQGGLSSEDRQILYQVARGVRTGGRVIHLGVWRGASLWLFMHALRGRNVEFLGFDCFDDVAIASMSGSPAISKDEALKYGAGFLDRMHRLTLVECNTLLLESLPTADCIFVDAGHSPECIRHDARLAANSVQPGGVIVFHDYNQPRWPAVTEVVDEMFGDGVQVFGNVAIVAAKDAVRGNGVMR